MVCFGEWSSGRSGVWFQHYYCIRADDGVEVGLCVGYLVCLFVSKYPVLCLFIVFCIVLAAAFFVLYSMSIQYPF